jgi:hypothetical protein
MFCSCGLHESLGIMMSVGVCFLDIVNSSFVFVQWIVKSRKLIRVIYFVSMVNFILGCCLMNSIKVLSVFVFFWL